MPVLFRELLQRVLCVCVWGGGAGGGGGCFVLGGVLVAVYLTSQGHHKSVVSYRCIISQS